MKIRKSPWIGIGFSILAIFCVVAIRTAGQSGADTGDHNGGEQWEYLAIAGPSTTSLRGSPTTRKEPNSSFGREAFVLEQHLDALGAKGWELVAIAGPPTDPAYYFKRPRRPAQP